MRNNRVHFATCLLAMFATTTTFELSARAGARKGGFPYNLNNLNKHGAKCGVHHFFISLDHHTRPLGSGSGSGSEPEPEPEPKVQV